MKRLNDDNKSVKRENAESKQKVMALEYQVNNLDAVPSAYQSRRAGVSEMEGENVRESVFKVLKVVAPEVNYTDIDLTHRRRKVFLI